MRAASSLKPAAITFDLGNVLVQVDHMRFCRRLAVPAGLSPQEVYEAVFATGLEPGYDTGRLSSQEFHRRVMSHFRLDLSFQEFCDLWCDIFDPMEAMAEVVERLAARFPLYLLSNTNPLHFDYIRERFADLLEPFQAFILSFEAGSRKPEAVIYQALIHKVGRPPSQILFLDDKLLFVEAAREQGLVAMQFLSVQDLQQELQRHGVW